MRDGISRKQIKHVLAPLSGAADNVARNGAIIDHQGYDSVSYLIETGTLADADATFTVLVQHGDESNMSDAAAVPDEELVSQTRGVAAETAASFAFNNDNQVRKIGYLGSKRYSRLTITPANNTGAWEVAAIAVLELASHEPITQAAA